MKSPAFSEDESSDNSFWIDLGQSPLGSDRANHQKIASPLPPFWFTFTSKRQSPKPLAAKSYSSPLYDGKDVLCRVDVIKKTAVCFMQGLVLDQMAQAPRFHHRRETEGEFRLLGRRGTGGSVEGEQPSRGTRVSFNMDRVSHSLDQGEASLACVYDESDGENQNEDDDWEMKKRT